MRYRLLCILFALVPVLASATAELALSSVEWVGGSSRRVVGTITIDSALAQNSVWQLSTSHPSATVPASVTIPAGATQTSFDASHTQVSADTDLTITATNPNDLADPLPVKLLALKARPVFDVVSVEGGRAVNLLVRLNTAMPSPQTVHLSSSQYNLLGLPAAGLDLSFPPGTRFKYLSLTTAPVATLTRAYIDSAVNGFVIQAGIALEPRPRVAGLTLPAQMYGRQQRLGTVTLKTAAPGHGTVVNLKAATAAISVPPSTFVEPGQTTATFMITAADIAGMATSSVNASTGFSSVDRWIGVKPVGVASLALSPESVTGGASVTGTVTLNVVVDVDTPIDVTSLKPNFAWLTEPVVVPAGSKIVNFTVHTRPVTRSESLQISAVKHTTMRKKTLTITP